MNLVLPWLVLAAATGVSRMVSRSWLEPGALVGLYWTLFAGAAIALDNIFPLSPISLWVVAWFVLLFQAGTWLAGHRWTGARHEAVDQLPDLGFPHWLLPRIRLGVLAFGSAAGLGVAGLIATGVARFGMSWSAFALIQLGNAFSVERYGAGDATPQSIRLLVYCVYPAAALGGLLAGLRRNRTDLWLSALPIAVSFMGGFVVAARSGLLFSVVMWLAAFLAVRVTRSRGAYSLQMGGVAAGALGAVFLAGTYVTFQYLRGGIQRTFSAASLSESALTTAFSPISVLDQWLRTDGQGVMALGGYTFAGPYSLLGLGTRIQGLYTEVAYFPGGDSSNLHTIVRGLIEDFGLLGSTVVLVLAGYLAHEAFQRCAACRPRWIPALMVFYGVALYSAFYSMFTNNSVVTGWVTAALIWLWPPIGGRTDDLAQGSARRSA